MAQPDERATAAAAPNMDRNLKDKKTFVRFSILFPFVVCSFRSVCGCVYTPHLKHHTEASNTLKQHIEHGAALHSAPAELYIRFDLRQISIFFSPERVLNVSDTHKP